MAGIYGNDAVEALYPLLAIESDGKKPDCSTNRYTLTVPSKVLSAKKLRFAGDWLLEEPACAVVMATWNMLHAE
jgi:hypothetical protein